jgi:hypothetical protein
MLVVPSPFLWDAFKDGAEFSAGSQVVRMRCREIGAIHLPTGYIVACDPFSEIHVRPFSRRVDPGSYDVFLAIADYGRDQRIAAAMILLAPDASPRRWELAGEKDAGPQSGFGYAVNSGRGCFLDRRIARILLRKAERGRLDRYQQRIESQLDEHSRPTWSWANAVLDEETGGNIVAFTTGVGDGSYPSFLGFDDTDRLICLATDFGLLDGRITGTP